MSSHHFVKEGQEPALLIDDPHTLNIDHVDLLLEWSPKVIVTQPALSEVLHWGIKIDVVIAHLADLESLKPKLLVQSPVKLLGFESDDLLTSAFYFLKEQEMNAVNVLADIYNSKIMDLVKNYQRDIDTVIFNNNRKWVFAKEGLFQKWVNTGELFGVHPVASQTYFKSEGFYTDWENEMLLEPIELTSAVTGKVSMQTNQKPLWIVEEVGLDIYK